MNENRLPDYLDHMFEAAQQACNYTEGLNKNDFIADKRTQQAVILNLVIIGETATKLLKDYSNFRPASRRTVAKHEGHAQPHRA